MKTHYLILLGFFFVSCGPKTRSDQTQFEIPYPEPRPDTTALRFLPGLVSTEARDFNSTFSPDGRSYYFTRSVDRQWDIFVATHDGTRWTEPRVASFCDKEYSEADPAFGPDGRLYFISDYHDGSTRTDHDIWAVSLQPDGRWSDPENIAAVNTDSVEYYVSFADDGSMYFGSNRPGGFGSHDIYRSAHVNGNFGVPENLGPSINSAESEHDPAVAPDGSYIIFKSENRPDGYGDADLYGSRSDGAGGWTKGVNLGAGINTPTYEYCAYFTPDGKYFFYSSEEDVKWVSEVYLRGRVER